MLARTGSPLYLAWRTPLRKQAISNTANTVSFSAGDDLSFKIQNNAGATSATIGNISIMAEV